MDEKIRNKILEKYSNASRFDQKFISVRSNRPGFFNAEKHVPKKGIIIDLGCGHGYFCHYMYLKSKKRNIIGIDCDPNKIKTAKLSNKDNKIEFILGDIAKTRLPKADAIVVLDVFYQIPDKVKEHLIKTISKKLKKNGVLVLKEPVVGKGLRNKINIIKDYFREVLVVSYLLKKPSLKFYYTSSKHYYHLFKKYGFEKVIVEKDPGKNKSGHIFVFKK